MQKESIYFAVDFLVANTKSLLDSTSPTCMHGDKKAKAVIIIGGDTGNDCVGTSIRRLQIRDTNRNDAQSPRPGRRQPLARMAQICKTDYGQGRSNSLYGHDRKFMNPQSKGNSSKTKAETSKPLKS